MPSDQGEEVTTPLLDEAGRRARVLLAMREGYVHQLAPPVRAGEVAGTISSDSRA